MGHTSSKIPIIIGGVIILIIIGVMVLAGFGKVGTVAVSDTPNNEATTTPDTSIPDNQNDSELDAPSGLVTYMNANDEYSVKYLDVMSVAENAQYPIVPDSTTKATVFSFATSTFSGSTVKEANISIAKTKTVCSTWPDGENTAPVLSTKTVDNFSFEYRELSDAGAGNFRTMYEYSTVKNNECFRITLYVHTTSPGAQFDSPEEVTQATEKNTELIKNFKDHFETIVRYFQFTGE
jgi:hypothetical protein